MHVTLPLPTTTPRRRRLGLATAAALLVLTGCGSGDPMAGHSMPPTPTGSASAGATTERTFNSDDVMFAAMMIPHHQQAIEMSDLILPKKGLDPEVKTMAEQIKAAQQPEIDTMNRWLEEWGTPPDHSSHGDDDGGMMTPEEMREMRDAEPKKAQRMYLKGMIEHHQGAIRMAETEITDGKDPETIALARSIVTTQQEEISTMQGILDRLG